MWGHAAASRHVGSLSRYLGVVDVFGRVDSRLPVYAVLVTRTWFRCVQACLERLS